MNDSSDVIFPVMSPDLQISFYFRFQEIKNFYLGEALQRVITSIDIPTIDNQLAIFVPGQYLNKISSFGIRGEVFFPVPLIIQTSPYLLAYYRLLYGLSKKDFYHKNYFYKFAALEKNGRIPNETVKLIPALCRSLISTGHILLEAIGTVSIEIIRNLQIITIGPQLRGGILNKIGQDANKEVFNIIHHIIEPYISSKTDRSIKIMNEAGKEVSIIFSNDPDISIQDILPTGINPIVAIEIKGGRDASNIYNRIGEAEKSHESAREKGFNHRWTIVRVAFDRDKLRRKYPNLRTTQFFNLDSLNDFSSKEYQRFMELFCSLVSIKSHQS
jgi:hypothetical protein